ncbi:MAG: MaoC/PaaZ C-terminal domain-containing protein [Gammaproteobacteria bacterium]|nr:MaoC/PaaZ C-terminal domain-containing protein [Gammaproteobacteria bacterium]MCZ6892838.1 MaoC/PaaZ C-terminal domain-containing protein [Gammaproteobacteria bacterium]
MPATRCLTASMLEIGMKHQAKLSFSHEQVERYCELSGDMNAIHRDVAAAQLRFPDVKDIVVPGGLIQITVTGLFGTSFPGDGSLGLTFTPERFRKPVCPDETVVVTIEVTKIRGELVEVNVSIHDAEQIQIGAAKARILAPDDSYHSWWAAQQAGT